MRALLETAWVLVLVFGPTVVIGLAAARVYSRAKLEFRSGAGSVARLMAWLAGGGAGMVALLIAGVVGLTAATGSGQAPFWLIFAPWAFAVGAGFGLAAWSVAVRRAHDVEPLEPDRPVRTGAEREPLRDAA